MPSVSVHIGVLVIAKDPARPDLAAVEVVAARAAETGHRVIARQSIPDTESAIRSQLARWMDDREIDVIVVLSAESDVISKALAPLVTEAIPGFADVFRWLAFQEAGASAMLSAAESARCGSTFVFVVPGAIGPAMDKLILPQFDPATTPRNLVDQLPRLKAKPPEAVPVPIPAEKTQGGSGLPARLPAISEGMRTRPRTGANIVSRTKAPSDPDTKPIDVAKLERQLERSMTPSHEDVTRPDLSLKLPRLPPGAVDNDDDDDVGESDDDHTMTDTVAVQPAPPLPPPGPVTIQPRKRTSEPPAQRARPASIPPRVPVAVPVIKPDSGRTPAITATPVGGVPALPARGPNVAAARESKPFSFSTPLRGGSAAPGSGRTAPRTGALPNRESTGTSAGTGAYRDASAKPGTTPPPRESTSAGTPAYPARADAAAPATPAAPTAPRPPTTTPPPTNRWGRPAGSTRPPAETAPTSSGTPTAISSTPTTRTAGAVPTTPAAPTPISATPTGRTATPTPATPTARSVTPTTRTAGAAPNAAPGASTPPLAYTANRPPAVVTTPSTDHRADADSEPAARARRANVADVAATHAKRSTTDVDPEPATHAKRSTTDVDDEPATHEKRSTTDVDDESTNAVRSKTDVDDEADGADSWAKTIAAANATADDDAASSWSETVSAAKVDLEPDAEPAANLAAEPDAADSWSQTVSAAKVDLEADAETIDAEPETIDAEPEPAPLAVKRPPTAPPPFAAAAATNVAATAGAAAAANTAAAAAPSSPNASGPSAPIVNPPHVARLPTKDDPRPRTSTAPPPSVRPARTPTTPPVAKATDNDLPRGAFSYPVKPKRGNLVLKLLLAALALGGSFFAVVYVLDKGDAPPEKAAITTPPPIDAAIVAVAPPADAALAGSADEPEIEMGTNEPAETGSGAGSAPTTGGTRVRPVQPRPTTTTTATPDAGATPTTTTTTTTEPAVDATAPVPEADLCDEANCVLSDYDKPCCQKYKAKGPEIAQRVGGVPETLDRSMVRAGVESIKPRVIACGEKSGVKGTVKISVAVSPEGAVTSSEVQDAPDAGLGSCVATALKSAKFKKSIEGGSFTYPFVF